MDWMKEENDLYVLIDVLKELNFITNLQIGTIDLNWEHLNNINKIKSILTFYNRDFPLCANEYNDEYDYWD